MLLHFWTPFAQQAAAAAQLAQWAAVFGAPMAPLAGPTGRLASERPAPKRSVSKTPVTTASKTPVTTASRTPAAEPPKAKPPKAQDQTAQDQTAQDQTGQDQTKQSARAEGSSNQDATNKDVGGQNQSAPVSRAASGMAPGKAPGMAPWMALWPGPWSPQAAAPLWPAASPEFWAALMTAAAPAPRPADRRARAAAAPRFAGGEVTDDAFLNGAVRLWQPANGYRAATDPVFLAAACQAKPGQSVLDVGSGAGAAAFCLAARVKGLRQEGVELSADYADLSRRNAQRNGVSWLAHCGDVRAAPLFLRSASYDHVITNPPFFEADAAPPSPDRGRDAAHRETAPLDVWLDFCLRRLKPKGWLTIIHRASRLDDILAALAGRAGDIRILPMWPRAGAPAKRVLIRARKGSRAPLSLTAGLVLHATDPSVSGSVGGAPFTAAATAVLRDGGALDF